MKLKIRSTELNEQQIFEAVNQISTASAVASLAIAKHTNMNKASAMLIGVGASLLITGVIKYLEE